MERINSQNTENLINFYNERIAYYTKEAEEAKTSIRREWCKSRIEYYTEKLNGTTEENEDNKSFISEMLDRIQDSIKNGSNINIRKR